jgi:hypothetical protein
MAMKALAAAPTWQPPRRWRWLGAAAAVAAMALQVWILQAQTRAHSGGSGTIQRWGMVNLLPLQLSLPSPLQPAPARPAAAAAKPATAIAAAPVASAAAASAAAASMDNKPQLAEPEAASVVAEAVPEGSDEQQAAGSDAAPPDAALDIASDKPSNPTHAQASTGFDWPPSTRMSYTLTGHYQGPVHGQAQVEWIREGARYQVHLDVSVGPSLAPFMQRRMSSEGRLSAAGLVPQRYEEETRLLWREPRRAQVQFDGDAVALSNGQRVAALPGLQDTASQFVQLTWLFTTQPQRLTPGEQIELPLALPRRVGLWRYEVRADEELDTPFGRIPVLHLKPLPGSGRSGELLAEAWFAPSLQYLPVRLLIQQDAQTWIDLRVNRLPLQMAAQTRR